MKVRSIGCGLAACLLVAGLAQPLVAVPGAADTASETPFRAQQLPATLSALAWLEGEWERPIRDGVSVERWEVTDAGLVGEALSIAGDEQRVTEALMIVDMDGDVFYVAKPPQNPFPIGFRLVSATADEFVFENPTHDFPQRITSRRSGDAMTVPIEGPGDDGQTQSVDFSFTRR